MALWAGAILIAAAVPLGLRDLTTCRRMSLRMRRGSQEAGGSRAQFTTLTSDSPLEEYVRYVHSTDPNHRKRAVALAGARLVKSRHADAIRMLDDGEITRLWELWQFDLQATPALCAAYDRALHRVVTRDDVYDWNVGELIKYRLYTFRIGRIAPFIPGPTQPRSFPKIYSQTWGSLAGHPI